MDWQPIETAPKDGRRLLLGWVDGQVTEGFWRWKQPPGFPNYRWSDDWIGWTRVEFEDKGINPTHWMPLPEPPTPSV